MSVSAELREYAETPDRYSCLGDDVTRHADERVCILEGATFASVSGVRVAGAGLDALLDEVRARIAAEKEPVWWLGPSTPAGVEERLRARGLRDPRDGSGTLHALLLTTAPEPVAGVEVRAVATLEDFTAAARIGWEAFGVPEELRARQLAHLEDAFRAQRAGGNLTTFLALVDGRPAAVGRSVHSGRGSFLIGGATLPEARGRGAYRALVRARWDDAVARGTPALVTHARPDTSAPILRRLGFAEVCVLRRVEDQATGSTSPDS